MPRLVWLKPKFFPSFSLSGLYGAQSVGFTNFLSAGGSVWAATLGAMQPLFGGLLTGQLDTAKGKQQEALANYIKTVRVAFCCESGMQWFRWSRLGKQKRICHCRWPHRPKHSGYPFLRYQGGYVDYLTVLEAQRVANETQFGLRPQSR